MSNINTSSLSMDSVPEFAAFLHNPDPDPTYGIPNELNFITDYALFVKYNDGYWTRFKKTPTNSHQLNALKEFIESGEQSKEIVVHHSQGGMFVAKFSQSERNENYNKTYHYKREDGSYVNFMVSYGPQIGFVNRMSEPLG